MDVCPCAGLFETLTHTKSRTLVTVSCVSSLHWLLPAVFPVIIAHCCTSIFFAARPRKKKTIAPPQQIHQQCCSRTAPLPLSSSFSFFSPQFTLKFYSALRAWRLRAGSGENPGCSVPASHVCQVDGLGTKQCKMMRIFPPHTPSTLPFR